MAKMMTDAFLRLYFSLPGVVADVFRMLGEEEWVGRLDLASVRADDPSSVDREGQRLHGDCVWTANFRGEDTVGACLVVEFQATRDPRMDVRMGSYVTGQYMAWARRYGRRKVALPLVYPVVIYTGSGKWTPSRNLDQTRTVPPGGTQLQQSMEYRVLCPEETDLDGPELRGNSAAMLLGLEGTTDASLWRGWAMAVLDELKRQNGHEVRFAFLKRLARWVPRRFPGERLWDLGGLDDDEARRWREVRAERNPWAESLVRQTLKKGHRKGHREGREEGREEAWKEFLADTKRSLVRRARLRFGDQVAASMRDLVAPFSDKGELDEVGDWIVTSKSGPALLRRFNGTGR